MAKYTVVMVYSDLMIDGVLSSWMGEVEAPDPERAAKRARKMMDDDGAHVVAVIKGEHDDLYEHNS